MRSPIGGVKAPQGFALFESFEGWDGEDLEWTPEGWTVDMRGEVERSESWTPCLPNTNFGLPAPADGIYSYAINYSEVKQDEWLITPEIEIAEGFNLSYWLYLDPIFCLILIMLTGRIWCSSANPPYPQPYRYGHSPQEKNG